MNTKNIDLLPKFESAYALQKWDELLSLLDPKLFSRNDSEELIAFPILAKVSQILTAEDPTSPNTIKIACLMCLGNSCFNGYMYKQLTSETEERTYCHKLYSALADRESLKKIEASNSYSFDSYFPYEGVVEWTIHIIKSYKVDNDLSDENLKILRLSIQFLCNLFTFAYKSEFHLDVNESLEYHSHTLYFLYDIRLKADISKLIHSEHVPLVKASCAFVHNCLQKFKGITYAYYELDHLCLQLLKPIKKGLQSARDALMLLLRNKDVNIQNVYNNMITEDKLYLLEVIHIQLISSLDESEEKCVLAKRIIEFFIQRFCKRSDLILKTVDSGLDEMEPREVVLLLDVLGSLTSESDNVCSSLEGYKSLLINCTYLLKSIQMIGKQSENCFTPLHKLSDIASALKEIKDDKSDESKIQQNGAEANSTKSDLYSHPAFGFKAGLIRIIGNMSYRNKECQDLLREMDVIPLLLDCCNIDARNPLIMQWTILALRNLCENNPTNQEIIRNCTRVGVVESSVLKEMGVTLHEDEEGKKIGIVPLPRESK